MLLRHPSGEREQAGLEQEERSGMEINLGVVGVETIFKA